MLDDLRQWALGATWPVITWVYGPAGAGKSAIMQTLASQLQDAGRLGACFFFKRGHATRGNGQNLFSTIAYQLALNIPWLRGVISQVVENDPSIIARSIETQMQKLISEPCWPYGISNPLAIIIDGLDECEDHTIQEDILRVLRNSCSDYTIPFCFFVASRPEPHIREMFDSPFYAGHCRSFNVEQSFEDVEKYLRNEFARIHCEHRTMVNIPLPWPSSDVLDILVSKSSGHFIYASTIIKFIDDKSFRPTERLAVVQDPSRSDSASAFEALDKLYKTILRSAPRQSQLISILCAIAHFTMTAEGIDALFGLAEGETRLILRGLHSLLDVPSAPDDNENSDVYDDEEHPISSHHASFKDFLRNPDRSGNFCVGTLNRRIDLARSLLQFYARPFQYNYIWLGYVQFIPIHLTHLDSDLSHLIRFITSLPPSGAAELVPLIRSINLDYIFHSDTDPRSLSSDTILMISWLEVSSVAFEGVCDSNTPAFRPPLRYPQMRYKPGRTMHSCIPSRKCKCGRRLRVQTHLSSTLSRPVRNLSAFSYHCGFSNADSGNFLPHWT